MDVDAQQSTQTDCKAVLSQVCDNLNAKLLEF